MDENDTFVKKEEPKTASPIGRAAMATPEERAEGLRRIEKNPQFRFVHNITEYRRILLSEGEGQASMTVLAKLVDQMSAMNDEIVRLRTYRSNARRSARNLQAAYLDLLYRYTVQEQSQANSEIMRYLADIHSKMNQVRGGLDLSNGHVGA